MSEASEPEEPETEPETQTKSEGTSPVVESVVVSTHGAEVVEGPIPSLTPRPSGPGQNRLEGFR